MELPSGPGEPTGETPLTRNQLPVDELRERVHDGADQCDLDALHEAVVAFYKGSGREPPGESEERQSARPQDRHAGENDCGND